MYYIADNNKNSVNCNCDLVILDNGNPILFSLIDINIITKKICADLIKGKLISLANREDITFNQHIYNYSKENRYRFKSERMDELTHTIIYNMKINDYIIDWNNEGIISIITKWLKNKRYMPITEDIVKKVLEYQDEQNKKYTYSQDHIYNDCDVYTNNDLFKDLKCYKVNVNKFKYILEKINLDTEIKDDFNWDNINTIDNYILTFLEPIKDKIRENISVLYNPNKIDNKIFEGKKKPYEGQIPIIQSAIEVLKRNKFVYLAAEQGVGKTLSASKIVSAYYKNKNPIVFITAPATTITQWKEELKASIKDKIDIIFIKKTDQFIKWYDSTHMQVDKPTFILCGKETFKLQYKLVPAIHINKQKVKYKVVDDFYKNRYSKATMPDFVYETKEKIKTVLTCPNCGVPLKNPLNKKEDVFFKEEDFKGNPKKSNYKCYNCGDILWQASYSKTKKTSVIDFIKRKNIIFDCIICDEIQESNNSGSIIGNSTRTLLRKHGKKVIALSGTPNNGYASSLYNILFALIPNILFQNNIFNEKDFIQRYGTLQAITKKNDDHRYYYSRGKAEIKDSDYKEIEGINPLVFTKFLSQNFITANLMDLGNDLPPFNEYYVPIEQSDEMKNNEHKLFEDIKKVNSFNAKMYEDSILRHYINNPFSWDGIFIESGDKSDIIYPTNIEEQILPKENKLIEIINKEYNENRKVWIYCDFNNGGEYMTGESLPNRLQKILEDKGFKVFQLKPSVKTYDRKDRIDKNKDKYDVFISNRKLVQVGLNLQFCPTYINYIPSYMVNDIEQANHRGLRANSTLENRVYHLYYKDTCEDKIIKRYQRKKAESNAILGKFNIQLENEDVRTASKFAKEINNNIDENKNK